MPRPRATTKSAEKGEGTHCKALDEAGKVVAEADSTGGELSCRGALRAKVKKERCEPGKKLNLSVVSVVGGKEGKPASFKVTCE